MIVDLIKTYIDDNFVLFAEPLMIDAFYDDISEAVLIRQEPSTAVDTRYLDKSRAGTFEFSLYARSESSKTANEQIRDLVEGLDLPGFEELTDETSIKIQPVTGAVFVAKTDNNHYVYTAQFALEYFIGG